MASARRHCGARGCARMARPALGPDRHHRKPAEGRGAAARGPGRGRRGRPLAPGQPPGARTATTCRCCIRRARGADDGRSGKGRIVAFGRDLRDSVALQQRLIECAAGHGARLLALARGRNPLPPAVPDRLRGGADRRRRHAEGARGQPGGARAVRRRAAPGWSARRCRRCSSRRMPSGCRPGGRGAHRGRQDACARGWPAPATRSRCRPRCSARTMPRFVLVRLAPCAPKRAGHGCAASARAGRRDQRRCDAAGLSCATRPTRLVFTDPDGRMLTANRAFVELAQLSAEEQVRGEPLDRWLGRTGVDLGVLIANLRQRGSVRPVRRPAARRVRRQRRGRDLGGGADVGDDSRAGLHHPRRRPAPEPESQPASLAMPRSAGQLTELVGRVPLKDIVARDHRPDRAAVHRDGAGADRRQPRLGGGDAGPVAAEPVRQAAPLRHGRPGADEDESDADRADAGLTTASVNHWLTFGVSGARSRHASTARPAPCRTRRRRRSPNCSSRSPGSRRCGPSPAAWSRRACRWPGRWPLVVARRRCWPGPLVCATSQAVNDWFDRHVDAINEPHRPIPSGRMPGRWGLYIAIAWTVLSLLVAAALGPWGFGAAVRRPAAGLGLQRAAAAAEAATAGGATPPAASATKAWPGSPARR